jgi:hypothetical protein
VSTEYGNRLGSDGSNPIYQNPKQYVYLVDDFISNQSNTTNGFGNLNWLGTFTGTGATATNGAVISGSLATNPGEVTLTTGTQSTGDTRLGIGASVVGLTAGFISVMFLIYIPTLSDGTNTYTIRIGLKSSVNGEPPAGVYFRYTDAGATPNWVIVARTSSVETASTSNTAVTSGAWIKLKIQVNAAGTSASYFVNDVELNVSPLSTNLPVSTDNLGPSMEIVKSAGTSARTFAIDLFTYYQKLTASR